MIVGRVFKVGESLAVTLPRAEADALGIREGDLVSVEIRKLGGPTVLSPEHGSIASFTGTLSQSHEDTKGHKEIS